VAKAPRDCPCTSGRRYAECCAPFHRGQREAPDAVALMRSRYAAYVVGDMDYLIRTLHRDHPDASRPHADVARELRAGQGVLKFPGLKIVEHRSTEGSAEVLFLARVFERGADRSFYEHARFLHDGTGWRYRSGEMVGAMMVRKEPTLATFGSLITPSR
jgi:SEC-C motif domain protein